MIFKIGQKYILTDKDSTFTPDRVGEEVEIVELEDKGKKYLAFKDRRGVSWPVTQLDNR